MPTEITTGPAARRPFRLTGRMVAAMFVGFFAVVIAANATMMTVAIRTMPGTETRSAYEASQRYNEEIARQQAQEARGWRAEIALARAKGDEALAVTMAARDGAPLSGLSLTVRLRHPATTALDRKTDLAERLPGRYEAAIAGLQPGAWRLELEARRGEETVFVSRGRVTVGDR